MRKGTKIKACTIFLAWSMIFTHGIVPHTHFDEDRISRYGQIHSSVHHHHESDFSTEFNSQCEDTGVCHISNFLFHHFNHDNLLIQTGKVNYLYSVLQTGQIISDRDDNFHTKNFFGSAYLRAPPIA